MRMNFTRKMRNAAALFNGHFIDVKIFYVLQFNKVPCIIFIGDTDVTKAYAYIKENFKCIATYQHAYFDHTAQKKFFNNIVFVLTENRMIELAGNYVQILHAANDYTWGNDVMKTLAQFRVPQVPAVAQTKVIGFARQPEMN